MICYLTRGLPGSGKSTLGRALDRMAVVIASDDYFCWYGKGSYEFRLDHLQQAHAFCQMRCRRLVDGRYPAIVVDNTNITAWECYPYVSYARNAGYQIEFHQPKTPWAWDLKELVKRNTHGVPEEAIIRMFNNFEPMLTVQKVLAAKGQPGQDAAEDTKAAWEAFQQCYASSSATA